MSLTGAATVAGVMGWPVTHSLSPRLHTYWLRRLRIDGAYVPLAVRPENLGQVLAILPKMGFTGVNLTVPYKERALPSMQTLDHTARAIGAVNTVTVAGDGSLNGRNTDAYGFLSHLKSAAPGWRPETGPAVVLGAGGAARAAVFALREAGAPAIRIVNRTRERAAALLRDMGLSPSVYSWQEVPRALGGAALLVNATSLGMKGAPRLSLELDDLPQNAVVYDLVYAPLETALLTAARSRGLACVDGLGMLIHQAVPAFEAFFGVRPEVTAEIRDVLLKGN